MDGILIALALEMIDGYQGLFVCIAGNGDGTNINENASPNYPGSLIAKDKLR